MRFTITSMLGLVAATALSFASSASAIPADGTRAVGVQLVSRGVSDAAETSTRRLEPRRFSLKPYEWRKNHKPTWDVDTTPGAPEGKMSRKLKNGIYGAVVAMVAAPVIVGTVVCTTGHRDCLHQKRAVETETVQESAANIKAVPLERRSKTPLSFHQDGSSNQRAETLVKTGAIVPGLPSRPSDPTYELHRTHPAGFPNPPSRQHRMQLEASPRYTRYGQHVSSDELARWTGPNGHRRGDSLSHHKQKTMMKRAVETETETTQKRSVRTENVRLERRTKTQLNFPQGEPSNHGHSRHNRHHRHRVNLPGGAPSRPQYPAHGIYPSDMEMARWQGSNRYGRGDGRYGHSQSMGAPLMGEGMSGQYTVQPYAPTETGVDPGPRPNKWIKHWDRTLIGGVAAVGAVGFTGFGIWCIWKYGSGDCPLKKPHHDDQQPQNNGQPPQNKKRAVETGSETIQKRTAEAVPLMQKRTVGAKTVPLERRGMVFIV